MGFFADSVDDPRYTMNMGLFRGIANNDVAGGLLAAEEGLLKKKITKAQLDNYASEIEARKLAGVKDQRQQALLESMFPGLLGGGAAAQGSAGAAPGAGPATGGNDILSLSKQLGIPPQAIQADLVFNGGKRISEMVAERSKPNWQNINGNLVNTNAAGFQGGFQPGMSASSDGRVTAWQPDGNGGLVVGAPRGALATYGAYQNVGEGAKANFDPVTVTPQGQPPQMTSRGALMASPQVQGRQIQPAQQAQMDQGRTQILQQEMAKAQAQLKAALASGDPQAAQRAATDVSALNRELGQAGGGSRATLGMPLQSEAEKAALVDQAKADVVPTRQRQSSIDTNRQTLAVLDKALDHPGLETATGLQGKLDPRNLIPGTDAKDFNVLMDQVKGKTFLQAFESLKGAGQITEVEGRKATDAIARLNTAQSTKEFKTALRELRDVVVSADARMTVGPSSAPSATSKPPTPMKGMVRGGYKFKGGDPGDPSSWEKM